MMPSKVSSLSGEADLAKDNCITGQKSSNGGAMAAVKGQWFSERRGGGQGGFSLCFFPFSI